ncbi:MAG: Cell division coordinator CpoB [Chlamydiales bacterium]|nr:Cell division coordinator CpoB [Chlamydiales bacterium]MCH9619757.1 Cell division coordinator CpoB [Chlamydiales bacterium]MCH9623363.1 Cell division coordinator CpoB [Chlamydiales bacterium]
MKFILALCLIVSSMEASYVRVGHSWSEVRYAPTTSVSKHFDQGSQLLEEKKWEEALENFQAIAYHFQDSPFYTDAIFHSALCYYYLGHFDIADKYFSHYLSLSGNLKYFEKTFEFKYHIAEYYREGRKKHLFGLERLPRVVSGKGSAFDLYNEVIASLPSREIAAKALFSKAALLRKKKEFKESIDALQTLIRRFPKHHLAAESYLAIGDIYLQQSRLEAQNPDILALSQVNAQHFKRSFPGDERISQMEACIHAMEEVYALSLYETGRFFERMKKPKACVIYYHDTIARYPNTKTATLCKERLEKIR